MSKKRKSLPQQTRKEIKSKVERYEREVRYQAIMNTLITYGSVVCMVLHEQDGWGNKRLNRFLEEVMSKFEQVQSGELTTQEVCQKLLEETGIDMMNM